jgi:hypothetical protein
VIAVIAIVVAWATSNLTPPVVKNAASLDATA